MGNYPKVSDYVPGVVSKLGNNQAITANNLAYKWVVEAVLNLSTNYPFVALQRQGPLFTLQTPSAANLAKQGYYVSIESFLNPGDDLAFFDLIWVWYNGAQNGPGTVLKYRTPPVLESIIQNTLSGGGSTPLYWTRYGDNIRIGPAPAITTYGYSLYQVKHPFTVSGFDYSGAANDPVLLPREWRDIIEYAAAIKGAPEVQMTEMVQVWNAILYGNPERKEPGLIKPLVSQFSRDAQFNERQLNVVVG